MRLDAVGGSAHLEDVALLTAMSLAEASAIGSSFGLQVTGIAPIPHGSVNSNFALELAGGERRFLRVCEESDRDAVVAQNELLAHLVGAGVATPAPMVRLDGQGTVAEHRGKPAVLFPFMPGDWICQKRVDERRMRIIGDTLATIHEAGARYAAPPVSRFGITEVRGRIDQLTSVTLPGVVETALPLIRIVLGELEGRVQVAERPTVIHGDVFRDNVLWHHDELSAVLDFESASGGHPSFDLMVTMLAWCFSDRLEQPLARALIAGYQRRRQLLPSEIDHAYEEARAAAVRFAVTRITDYELRPRGVVVYKDFRRFMGRLEALEMIGARGFPSWLGLRG